MKKSQGFHVRKTPLHADTVSPEESKFASHVPMDGEEEALPRTYGRNVICLMAQEPHRLFVYWDLEITKHPGGPLFLRCLRDHAALESEFEVQFENRHWYIPVSLAGEAYSVQLGCYRNEEWLLIAESAWVRTPAGQLSERLDFQAATRPPTQDFAAFSAAWGSVADSSANEAAVHHWMRQLAALGDSKLASLRDAMGSEFVGRLAGGSLDAKTLATLIYQRFADSYVGSPGADQPHLTTSGLGLLQDMGSEIFGNSSFWQAFLRGESGGSLSAFGGDREALLAPRADQPGSSEAMVGLFSLLENWRNEALDSQTVALAAASPHLPASPVLDEREGTGSNHLQSRPGGPMEAYGS